MRRVLCLAVADYSTRGVPALQPSSATAEAGFVDSIDFEGANGPVTFTFRFWIDEAKVEARGTSFVSGAGTTDGLIYAGSGVRYVDEQLGEQVGSE